MMVMIIFLIVFNYRAVSLAFQIYLLLGLATSYSNVGNCRPSFINTLLDDV